MSHLHRQLDRLQRLLELDGQSFHAKHVADVLAAFRESRGWLETILSRLLVGEQLPEQLQTLLERYPHSILDLFEIPGVGPKKIKLLYERLGISTLEGLEKACLENRLQTLDGFGVKTQEKILKGIDQLKTSMGRVLLHHAYPPSRELLAFLRSLPSVSQADIAGSLRRWTETVKDVELVAATEDSEAVMEAFATHPLAVEVIARGPTKTSIRLASGMQVDLRTVVPSEYAFALAHFTGSKEHNTVMRQRAKERGWKLNEYGLFEGEEKKLRCDSEEAIFHALGLAFIPPEMREDQGEFEKAEVGSIPRLVEVADLKGIFHAHSTYSDGAASLHEMAEATRALGFSYLGITDHSRSCKSFGGLSIDRVREQHKEIDTLNALWPSSEFQILKGIESDILPDGGLDYPDEILATFDFVIASVHENFQLTEAEMTQRILTAIEHPKTRMIGHVTNRLLLRRDGYPVDLRAVIDAAIKHRVVIELNASPYRLDIDWRFLAKACERGLLTSINPDAHTTEGLQHTLYGVHQARKAGLPKEAILNTRSLPEIRAFLLAKR